MEQQEDNVVEVFTSDIGVDIKRIAEVSQKKFNEEIEQHLNYEIPGVEQPPANNEMIEPMEPQVEEIALSPDEIQERSGLLNYIKTAQQHFPREWQAMGISDDVILGSDNETLGTIIEDYKFRRDSSQSFQTLFMLANRVILMAEGMGASFGLQLGGLSKRLEQNEDYNDALKCVIHDKANRMRLTPIQRLCIAIGTTAYSVHLENSARTSGDDEYEAF